MGTNQKIALPGYMSPVGYSRKIAWAGDMFGSNNYQAGGYNENANSGFGMSAFEKFGIDFGGINIGGTFGTYIAKSKPGNISSNTEAQAPTFQYVTVQWFYAANNVEVANNTDLSAQGVRVDARGV